MKYIKSYRIYEAIGGGAKRTVKHGIEALFELIGTTGASEVIKKLYEKLKEIIGVYRSAKCEALQNGNILTVNIIRKGKMSLLFEINKDTNILRTDFGSKIKLTSSQVDEIDNLVHWYKK